VRGLTHVQGRGEEVPGVGFPFVAGPPPPRDWEQAPHQLRQKFVRMVWSQLFALLCLLVMLLGVVGGAPGEWALILGTRVN
jgi:hypothetical protein